MKILSFNLYNYTYNIDKFCTNNLQNINPDIICTQEDGNNNISTFNPNYKLKAKNGNNCDTVGVYCNNNIISSITKIHSEPRLKRQVRRNGIIFKVNDLSIANIHLSGGRYVDRCLLYKFNDFLRYKMDLIEHIVKYQNVDIICGDFNSIYHHNNEKYNNDLNNQIKYFSSIKYNLTQNDKDNIIKWNKYPYEYLTENNYVYIKPNNDNITSHLGKSIVDCFWVKKALLKKYNFSCDIINLNENISDHNPILLTINHGLST